MTAIHLRGATPVPLASYLKALGILRLVAEQKDANATGWWEGEHFVLQSTLDKQELERFFLYQYKPTPVISPWSGRAGFLEGEDVEESTRKGAVIRDKILLSEAPRFSVYREIYNQIVGLPPITELNQIRTKIKTLGKKKKGTGLSDEEKLTLSEYKKREKRIKNSLLKYLRNSLPDEFLPWMDACLMVTEKLYPSPLLGSGGNEGSMDFSVNHVETLLTLFSEKDGSPSESAKGWLSHALFGDPAILSRDCSPGLLSPASVGGANMGTGFQGDSLENPWNTILMLEGVVLLNAVVTRRHGATSDPSLSFPFTFDPSYSRGSISLEESARPEFWAPLWKLPLSYKEVKSLLKEGRLRIGTRLARNGLDAIRAATTLGVDRGVTGFQRYGIYERRGQGYYVATPLNRINVRRNPDADLIAQLERGGFLQRVRQFARNKNMPGRLRESVRNFEQTLFDLAEHGGPRQVQRCVVLYGQVVSEMGWLAQRDESLLRPPYLDAAWVLRADDGSAEFQIAVALAGIGQGRTADPPLACHLFPLTFDGTNWQWRRGSPDHVWRDENLSAGLAAVARRRWLAAIRQAEYPEKPFYSPVGVSAQTLSAWLWGELFGHADIRITDLVRGLSLCRIAPLPASPSAPVEDAGLPAAWYALRAFFTSDARLAEAGLLPPEGHLPPDTRILQLLLAGRTMDAMRLAWRQLAAHGAALPSFSSIPEFCSDIGGRRVLASLVIPLRLPDLKRGLRGILDDRATIFEPETHEEIA